MMFRKLGVVCVIFLIVLTSMAAISAADGKTVTIDDIKFNIPDGYENKTISDELHEDESSYGVNKLFVKGDDVIAIGILVDKTNNITFDDFTGGNMGNCVNKTINGQEGLYLDKKYSDNGLYCYMYIVDGKFVALEVSDLNVLEDVVVDSF